MPNAISSSGSQSSVRRFINCVRLALVQSVTCSPPCGPPVRCQTRKVSMLPNRTSPASACSRAPAHIVQHPANLQGR